MTLDENETMKNHALELARGAANFLIGLHSDPRLPQDVKQAVLKKANAIHSDLNDLYT